MPDEGIDVNGRWVEVTPSQFSHERAGLRIVRDLLGNEDPFRAWSNFEFRDHEREWHEVDLLVLGRDKLYLIELKYYAGVIGGNDLSWRRDGGVWEKSPLRKTRHTAKRFKQRLVDALSERIRSEGMNPLNASTIPFVQELVFLHHETVICQLKERKDLYGLDRLERRTRLLGISKALLRPASRGAISAKQSRLIAELMTEITLGQSQWRAITDSQAKAMSHIVDVARQKQCGRFEVVSDSGCGKTSLLSELVVKLRNYGYVTLFVSCPRPNAAADQDLARKLEEVGTCKAVIAQLADDVERNSMLLDERILRRIAKRIRVACTAGRGPTMNAPGLETNENERLVRNVHAMRDEVVSAVGELGADHPVAIVVDELNRLEAGNRDWLQGVFERLPQTLVVCARQSGSAGTMAQDRQLLELRMMTPAETKDYVVRMLSDWAPETAAAIAALISGPGHSNYPVWVATWCQMIRQWAEPGATVELIKELLYGDDLEQWLPTDHGDVRRFVDESAAPKFREFVDNVAARIVGRRIPLFDQLAVLARITQPGADKHEPMLTVLSGIDKTKASALYDWLKRSEFMTSSVDDPNSGLRLHGLIRRHANTELRTARYETYLHLQTTAEGYYRELLNFDDDVDEDSPWTAWSQYEDPTFRRNCRDWLYHAARVGTPAFEDTQRGLIRLFLEAFWWWDADVPTDFSGELLADYRVLWETRNNGQRGGVDEWLRRLEEFRAAYVSNWQDRIPGRHTERWTQVHTALLALWGMHGLDTKRIPGDRALRRIQILLCCFLGEATWYGSTGDEESGQAAAAWFTAAAAACTEPPEEWIKHWAIFKNADLWVETDPQEAKRLVTGLSERIDAEKFPDNELRVQVTRLHGDLVWGDGDWGRALDVYARAVLHSYVYQVRQERRMAPNDYSLALYQQMLTRTEQRLDEARRNDRDDLAEAAIARQRVLFAPYWKGLGSADDERNGFPPAPRRSDLNKLGTPYTDAVESMIHTMAAQLDARPLNATLDLVD